MRRKELKNKAATSGTDEEINVLKTKRMNNERSRRERETIRSCRYCGGSHRRGEFPAYGQTCKKSGSRNRFSQVCFQRNSSQRQASANIITQSQQLSDDDSGDSIMTLDLSPEPAEADPSKVDTIINLTKPTDVQGIRRILGMTNYLAKFLPKLSDVSAPLRELTRKEHDFYWLDIHDQAFDNIKELVSSPPLLKYYEPRKPLVLQCDASEKCLAASLLQEGKLIAYAS